MEAINTNVALALDKMIREFDLTIGRMVSYRRLAGRTNDPYERAAMTTLIAEEKREADALRRIIDELATQL